ncbi:MAG: hypothetical protein SOY50_07370, partial [Ruminococcus callidus]|nr:hypothetical protein [Ruminococcus callidus]
SLEKYSTGIFLIGFLLEKGNQGEPRKSIFMIASPERGDSPRGGEMPAGQRGPLSTRGTAVRRWRGFFVKSFMMFSA